MSGLVKPISLGLSLCAYAIDSILCKKIHNPLVSSLAVSGTLAFVAFKLHATLSPYNYSDDPTFLPDLLLNVINLIFIVRFPLRLKTVLRVTSNKYLEGFLFVCLNVVAVLSLYSSYPFSSFLNLAFRGLLWVLVACPYVILALNLAEYRCANMTDSSVWNMKAKLKTLQNKPPRPGAGSLLALIVDTNNSFLAIFIAQSFAAVNLDLPFYESYFIPVLYKYAAYSMKFYLIYCFVLYEIAVVIYEVDDIKSYAELYQPIQLCVKKSSWETFRDNTSTYFLSGAVVFAISFDSFMAWRCYSSQFL
ncbi:hypothetical protein METBIDRAFT_194047 [Metschnikowia bicuspidata var. bicuspidata NRRL YB-4993]|uniref:Uncharacterized protein n=1 Tax=Metschnikowia bicuspidata var. bicuspidata NRRL YB-4993 TaxID=869754 RepID=A0A1A0H8B5_9ASCO|nr:hypothetical protein METBIDRAFT_194047 [Metschnikowia bicuspidata var. bicuspidata NRRL YB-4993]OBA20266.1 hypothetical protein METBIDRAFT_194047 [Metschnikowia bicuspidata var. bicuspidata NRRL YB-4993]